MNAFLEVVKRDRDFRDDGGRLALPGSKQWYGRRTRRQIPRRLAAFLF